MDLPCTHDDGAAAPTFIAVVQPLGSGLGRSISHSIFINQVPGTHGLEGWRGPHFDLVHKFHGLNDTDGLALRHLVSLPAVGWLPGSWRAVVHPAHWGQHLHTPHAAAVSLGAGCIKVKDFAYQIKGAILTARCTAQSNVDHDHWSTHEVLILTSPLMAFHYKTPSPEPNKR